MTASTVLVTNRVTPGSECSAATLRDGRINFDLVCAPVQSPQEGSWAPVSSAAAPGAGGGGAFQWRGCTS
jgi:hypothetical protein